MIKGIIGYKVREDKDLQPILMKLKSNAMQYPGFMSVENLISEKDISVIAMVSAWDKLEDWRLWENSRITQELLRQAEALLIGEPRVTTYRIIPAVRWV
jgi:heme-degrading monooxygenase HmoA